MFRRVLGCCSTPPPCGLYRPDGTAIALRSCSLAHHSHGGIAFASVHSPRLRGLVDAPPPAPGEWVAGNRAEKMHIRAGIHESSERWAHDRAGNCRAARSRSPRGRRSTPKGHRVAEVKPAGLRSLVDTVAEHGFLALHHLQRHRLPPCSGCRCANRRRVIAGCEWAGGRRARRFPRGRAGSAPRTTDPWPRSAPRRPRREPRR